MAKTFYGDQIVALTKAVELCAEGGCKNAIPFINHRISWLRANDYDVYPKKESLSFQEVLDKIEPSMVDPQNKNAYDVADEIRESIRNWGWACLDDGECESDWLDEHPEYSADNCEECCIYEFDLLCLNTYSGGHDVDWRTFQITFYGKYGEYGVFIVSF